MSRGLRNGLVLFVVYFAVLELMLGLAMEFWPDFREFIGPFQLIAKFPVLRNWVELLRDGGLPAYVVIQHFFKGCNFLGGATAVLIAVNAVAGEAHRGTLEVLLSGTRSRTRILLERWIGGALVIVVPVFLSSWTTPALLEQWDEVIALEPVMLCAVHQSAFLLALYSGTFFFSTIGRNPTRIALGVMFFCIVQFAVYFMFEATSYSLVRLVEPRMFVDLFQTPELDWTMVGGLFGAAAFGLVASIVAFGRRIP